MAITSEKRLSTIIRALIVLLIITAGPALCQCSPSEFALKKVVGMEYPWFARIAVLQGAVELIATVSPEGGVTKVRILSGAGPLAQASKQVLSKWQFARCAPKHEQYDVKLTFSFQLTGSCDATEHCPSDFEVELPDKVKVTAKSIRAILN